MEGRALITVARLFSSDDLQSNGDDDNGGKEGGKEAREGGREGGAA